MQKDFAALAETMALAAGMKLTPENKNVADRAGVNCCRPRESGDPYAAVLSIDTAYGSPLLRSRWDDKRNFGGAAIKKGPLAGPCVHKVEDSRRR